MDCVSFALQSNTNAKMILSLAPVHRCGSLLNYDDFCFQEFKKWENESIEFSDYLKEDNKHFHYLLLYSLFFYYIIFVNLQVLIIQDYNKLRNHLEEIQLTN